jgi:hypothetical protein
VGRQNHLIVFVITGLGAHHPDQILSTDEAARLAAGYPQVPHGQVLAMLSRSCLLVKHEGAEAIPVKIGKKRVHSWLTRTGQRQHNDLARLLLLPCNEIIDRLQAEFLVHGQQIIVQHRQIPLHVHQLSRQLAAADDQLRERVSGLAAPVSWPGNRVTFV